MRCRPRNLMRRRRWPLRLGLFLIYVFVQYIASTSSETTVFSSSSTQHGEDWMSEPTGSSTSFDEEIVEVSSPVSTVVEKPKNEVPTERSEGEGSSSKERGAKVGADNTHVRDLSKVTVNPPKKENVKPGRDIISTTVSTSFFTVLDVSSGH